MNILFGFLVGIIAAGLPLEKAGGPMPDPNQPTAQWYCADGVQAGRMYVYGRIQTGEALALERAGLELPNSACDVGVIRGGETVTVKVTVSGIRQLVNICYQQTTERYYPPVKRKDGSAC
jgi:hypothetical protein